MPDDDIQIHSLTCSSAIVFEPTFLDGGVLFSFTLSGIHKTTSPAWDVLDCTSVFVCGHPVGFLDCSYTTVRQTLVANLCAGIRSTLSCMTRK